MCPQVATARSHDADAHLPYSATLTLPKNADPAFLFEGVLDPQRFTRSTTSEFRARDFFVSREAIGDTYVYRVRAASPFTVRNGSQEQRVEQTGSTTLSFGPPVAAIIIPPPVVSNFNATAWLVFA